MRILPAFPLSDFNMGTCGNRNRLDQRGLDSFGGGRGQVFLRLRVFDPLPQRTAAAGLPGLYRFLLQDLALFSLVGVRTKNTVPSPYSRGPSVACPLPVASKHRGTNSTSG